MLLLILGAIVAIVGVLTPAAAKRVRGRLFIIIGIIMMGVGLATSAFVVIPAGEVGVQVLLGDVYDNILPSGLRFVNPAAHVENFDTRTQNYTMSATHAEGDQLGDDAIRVLSADGLEVVIDLTVLYRIEPLQAPRILKTIGTDYKNLIVRPISRTRIRDNAVYYDAVALYSTKRDEFQNRIFTTIKSDFEKRGLVLEQLLIRNITLPASVKASIESKINAEQDAQKMEFVLQKEKQEAERKRVEAQGISDYQRIISQNLSDRQLQYERIKAQMELAKSPNSKIVILGGNGNTPLMLDTR